MPSAAGAVRPTRVMFRGLRVTACQASATMVSRPDLVGCHPSSPRIREMSARSSRGSAPAPARQSDHCSTAHLRLLPAVTRHVHLRGDRQAQRRVFWLVHLRLENGEQAWFEYGKRHLRPRCTSRLRGRSRCRPQNKALVPEVLGLQVRLVDDLGYGGHIGQRLV